MVNLFFDILFFKNWNEKILKKKKIKKSNKTKYVKLLIFTTIKQ